MERRELKKRAEAEIVNGGALLNEILVKTRGIQYDRRRRAHQNVERQAAVVVAPIPLEPREML